MLLMGGGGDGRQLIWTTVDERIGVQAAAAVGCHASGGRDGRRGGYRSRGGNHRGRLFAMASRCGRRRLLEVGPILRNPIIGGHCRLGSFRSQKQQHSIIRLVAVAAAAAKTGPTAGDWQLAVRCEVVGWRHRFVAVEGLDSTPVIVGQARLGVEPVRQRVVVDELRSQVGRGQSARLGVLAPTSKSSPSGWPRGVAADIAVATIGGPGRAVHGCGRRLTVSLFLWLHLGPMEFFRLVKLFLACCCCSCSCLFSLLFISQLPYHSLAYFSGNRTESNSNNNICVCECVCDVSHWPTNNK